MPRLPQTLTERALKESQTFKILYLTPNVYRTYNTVMIDHGWGGESGGKLPGSALHWRLHWSATHWPGPLLTARTECWPTLVSHSLAGASTGWQSAVNTGQPLVDRVRSALVSHSLARASTGQPLIGQGLHWSATHWPGPPLVSHSLDGASIDRTDRERKVRLL
jgi:hypothetical protein